MDAAKARKWLGLQSGSSVPGVHANAPRRSSQHRQEQLSIHLYSALHEIVGASASGVGALPPRGVLYTPEQRQRRDATRWTLVQGILAPVQFAIFLVSAGLIARYLLTGEGYALATASVVVKTLALYAIMITGSIWEREVFGCYLFAPAFYWEDVVSIAVLALHTAYLVAVLAGFGTPRQQIWLAVVAYAAYLINATQFLLKLRAARRSASLVPRAAAGGCA